MGFPIGVGFPFRIRSPPKSKGKPFGFERESVLDRTDLEEKAGELHRATSRTTMGPFGMMRAASRPMRSVRMGAWHDERRKREREGRRG